MAPDELPAEEKFTFRKVDLGDQDLMEQIYRLRFQVYCHECGFIKAEDYPNGLEMDDYDKQSLHFVAINEDGDVIGTMRMIQAGKHPLPIQEHCPNLPIYKEVNFSTAVEISRLVISKRLRRRKDDKLYYEPQVEDKTVTDGKNEFFRRAKPMAFGLYREMYLESKRVGFTHWFSLMEKGLWLLLRLHGFLFEPVGEEVDVSGPVRPYLGEITRIEEEVKTKFPKFYKYFTDDSTKSLHTTPTKPLN